MTFDGRGQGEDVGKIRRMDEGVCECVLCVEAVCGSM